MTPEEQYIALLEWDGWRYAPFRTGGPAIWIRPDGFPLSHRRTELPPLTLDLCAEWARKLRSAGGNQFTGLDYIENLFRVVWGRDATGNDYVVSGVSWNVIEATKEQRAEALCRTKWPERFKEKV